MLADHDLRVLHYVAAARETGQSLETVFARLDAMQAADWDGLPPTPPDWEFAGESMPVAVAASRAYDVAQVAVLQRELQHAQQALETAQQRVDALETDNAALRASQNTTESELTAAKLELERMRGEVAALRARLAGYALSGDNPIPLAGIILVTALAVAALVIVLLVVVRLVL